MRGRVPGGTTGQAQQQYKQMMAADPRFVYYGRVLRDGERVRVPMMLRDGMLSDSELAALPSWQRDHIVAHRFWLNDSLDLHKPGPRYVTDKAALEAKQKAYEDSVVAFAEAWRTSANDPIREAAVPRGTGDARMDAYLESVDDLQNAWKRAR